MKDDYIGSDEKKTKKAFKAVASDAVEAQALTEEAAATRPSAEKPKQAKSKKANLPKQTDTAVAATEAKAPAHKVFKANEGVVAAKEASVSSHSAVTPAKNSEPDPQTGTTRQTNRIGQKIAAVMVLLSILGVFIGGMVWSFNNPYVAPPLEPQQPESDIKEEDPSSAESSSLLYEVDYSDITGATKPWIGLLTPGHWVAGYDFPAGYYTLTAVEGFGSFWTNNTQIGTDSRPLSADQAEELEFTQEIYFSKGTMLSVIGLTVRIEAERADVAGWSGRENKATQTIPLETGSYVFGVDYPAGVYDFMVTSGSGYVLSGNEVVLGGVAEFFTLHAEQSGDMTMFHGLVLEEDCVLRVDEGLAITLVPTQAAEAYTE